MWLLLLVLVLMVLLSRSSHQELLVVWRLKKVLGFHDVVTLERRKEIVRVEFVSKVVTVIHRSKGGRNNPSAIHLSSVI